MFKNKLNGLLAVAIIAFAFQACEDPETALKPVNPDLSEEAVIGTTQSAARTINGLERQLAELQGEYVHLTEIASDNYLNTQTFYNQFLDVLNIDPTDDDINDTQFELARMRELAKAGLNTIGPGDPDYTADQEAQFNFFIGLSHLLAGELFTSLPAEPLGPAQSASQHLQLAEQFFRDGEAKAEDPFIKTSCTLARARALYYLGDKDGAVAAASAAIAADPSFIRYVMYDRANSARTDNEMQNAVHDRGTFDDLQPLPRLDFLDPKYNDIDPVNDMNIPLLKIEEAHLILCEAAIADGELGVAQSIMKDLIALVATRPTSTFDDSVENRTERAPGSRPDSTNVAVAASPGAPFRPGLVLDRNDGDVTVPIVSGTSVTDAMVDAISTEDEALELLYLMRQEIFFSEGRRMTDMGIKFTISQVELLANPNVKEGDLVATIPPFFEAIKDELDAIEYTPGSDQCTIKHDVNAIIVANKTSDFVAPFH
ncbi:MAG: hypothetical protein D6772_02445 [Bacteroidetes bacterium]|nr:MAG: hypothetical protein D6772_02445 [Bacteroidota bacterium]